jgi:hypothetical protein
MSDGAEHLDDLEARIANAITLARDEQERWQAQAESATDEAGQLEAAIHLAASRSVVEVLEEVLEPGTHAQQHGASD